MGDIIGDRVFLESDLEGADRILGGNAGLAQATVAQPLDGGDATAGGYHFVAGLEVFDLDFAIRGSDVRALEIAGISHGAALEGDQGRVQAVGVEARSE